MSCGARWAGGLRIPAGLLLIALAIACLPGGASAQEAATATRAPAASANSVNVDENGRVVFRRAREKKQDEEDAESGEGREWLVSSPQSARSSKLLPPRIELLVCRP